MATTTLDLARWQHAGFLRLDGFLSAPTLAALQVWVDDIEAWPAAAGPWLHHDELTDAGPRRTRTENFVPFHAGIRQLLTEGALVQMASALFGEPAVLYKEKINYKHAGGAGFAPHQDQSAYPHIAQSVTCLLAVDDATVENGWRGPSPLWGQRQARGPSASASLATFKGVPFPRRSATPEYCVLDVCCINTPPVARPEVGLQPDKGTGEGFTKWTSSPKHRHPTGRAKLIMACK